MMRGWGVEVDRKNRIWKFQVSIKKGVKFPGMIKKKLMWNFQRALVLALGISKGLFQKKSNRKGWGLTILRICNFQGYQRNSM